MSTKLKQLRKDVRYIQGNYGEIYDYCGGWCNNERFDWLLFRDNSDSAVEYLLESLIDLYFTKGYVSSTGFTVLFNEGDKKDKILIKIADRYGYEI